MGGLDDLMAESADRWAAAERRAIGVTDKGLGKALSRYFSLYLPIGFVLLFIIGAVLGKLLFQGEWSALSVYLASGSVLATLGAMVGGLIYNLKVTGPAVDMGRIDVTVSLNDDEKKALRREILGKAPINPSHLAVKRAVAVQTRKGLATQLLYTPGFAFWIVLQAANFDTNLFWWLWPLFGALYIVSMLFLARDFRRAGTFLSRTAMQI